MRLFKRKTTSEEWTRMNIARTIYSTIINQCYREAHTAQQYKKMPETASKLAVLYADALLDELKNDRGRV